MDLNIDKKTYKVIGMSWAACAKAVEKAAQKVDGVINVSVNIATEKMDIEFDKNKVTFKELKSSIEKVGYSIKQEIKAKKEVIDEDKLRKAKEIKTL